MSSLAGDLAALGRLDQAERLAEQAAGRWEAYVGAEHPATLVCLTNLSVYRRLLGRREEALDAHRYDPGAPQPFSAPSVYCADLALLVDHIHRRLAPDAAALARRTGG